MLQCLPKCLPKRAPSSRLPPSPSPGSSPVSQYLRERPGRTPAWVSASPEACTACMVRSSHHFLLPPCRRRPRTARRRSRPCSSSPAPRRSRTRCATVAQLGDSVGDRGGTGGAVERREEEGWCRRPLPHCTCRGGTRQPDASLSRRAQCALCSGTSNLLVRRASGPNSALYVSAGRPEPECGR